MRVDGRVGVIVVTRDVEGPSPTATVDATPSLGPVLEEVATRVAHLLNLDADPEPIDAHLAANGLSDSVERMRGVRVPGAFDGFELALRAILGQQVTVKGATTLMSRLTTAFGDQLNSPGPALTHLTPTAHRLAEASAAEIGAIGLPAARAATLFELAKRVASGTLSLDARTDATHMISQLRAIPGVGPWTAEYITMRAAHWSDAFPATDIALRRAAGGISASELVRMAERWRPWRAYAAMRLWLSGSIDAGGATKRA